MKKAIIFGLCQKAVGLPSPRLFLQFLFFLLVIFSLLLSCRKAVDIGAPTTSIVGNDAYSSNSTATSVITGIYSNLFTDPFTQGQTGISMVAGVSADELTDYYQSNIGLFQFYTNALNSKTTNGYFWSNFYKYIYEANVAIEGLSNSSTLTPAIKTQLLGEAKFVRSFVYFYAVNLFGDVPLITTSDYQINATTARSPATSIYRQIIADLQEALVDLNDNYVDGSDTTATSERVRPTKSAAAALLARTYLYTKNWDSARIHATTVINNTTMFSLCTDLNTVFLSNSTETIWQLEANVGQSGYDTYEGNNFILINPPANDYNTPTALSTFLLNAFEPGDQRLQDWVGVFTADSVNYYYYPFKYKVKGNTGASITPTESLMMLRLSEQYLIRAEAQAQLNDLNDAANDLNVIRGRAGLPNTTATTQPDMLAAILHERQVELFTEWGHRWLDLIRTGNISITMGSPGNVYQAKNNSSGTWNSYMELFPIPLNDLQLDPNLRQNSGY